MEKVIRVKEDSQLVERKEKPKEKRAVTCSHIFTHRVERDRARKRKAKTLNYVCEAGAEDSKGPLSTLSLSLKAAAAVATVTATASLNLKFNSDRCHSRFSSIVSHPNDLLPAPLPPLIRYATFPRGPPFAARIPSPTSPSMPVLSPFRLYTFLVREFGFTSWGRRTNDLSLMYATHTIPQHFPFLFFFSLSYSLFFFSSYFYSPFYSFVVREHARIVSVSL